MAKMSRGHQVKYIGILKFRYYNQLHENRLSTRQIFEHLGLVGPKCEEMELSEAYFRENIVGETHVRDTSPSRYC